MMGGQLTSTVLTLVVIPSIYVLVTRLTERFFVIESSESEDNV
jgi:Cu/Ag efflux pump CusA